jgi:hypothetical protein
MTIEEYLKSEAEYIERMLSEEDDLEASSYLEGKRDAYREILEKLPEIEHETTLREVVEECLKHESEGGCGDCVLLREPSFANPYYCEVGGMPAGWGFKRIEKKMKEARK